MNLLPPPWRTLRGINLAVAALCLFFAFYAENRWVIMFDSVTAGALLASAVWIGYVIRMNATIDVLTSLDAVAGVIIEDDRKNSELLGRRH